jgi:hypothetical protein
MVLSEGCSWSTPRGSNVSVEVYLIVAAALVLMCLLLWVKDNRDSGDMFK